MPFHETKAAIKKNVTQCKEMKRLYYLSATSFSQVDLGVLPELSKRYDLTYGLVTPTGSPYVSIADIKNHCRENDIRLRLFPFERRLRDLRIGLDFKKVLDDIRQTRPDIIYTISHDIPLLSLLCLTLPAEKTIIAIHDVEFHSGSKFPFFLKLSRMITMAHFTSFQVFSKNQEIIFRNKYPKKKIFNIPLSLGFYGDLTGVPSVDANSNYDVITFLFFGNILPYKGLKSLLAAINNLSLKYSNFKLVVAGQCPDWNTEYEPVIENKSIVTKLIHFIDSTSIPGLFSNAHYLVLPYAEATQSGPLMMAYNFNIPVIASNIDSFNDMVVEGTSGYLYDNRDETALGSVLEAALVRSQDDYNDMRHRLRQHTKLHYSAVTLSKKYEKMFDNLS
jgi:glycosyltransferase involved in cell wall biosynthesis